MSTLTKDQINSKMKSIHYEVRDFARTLPGLEDYTPTLKLDWSPTRKFSRGGLYSNNPGVNYAMVQTVHSIEDNFFGEYASFSADPYIGSVKTTNWELICYTLSCHEQAHAIRGFQEDGAAARVHDSHWKDVYRILRNKFVNPFLKKKWEVDKSANTINQVEDVSKQADQYLADLKINGPMNGIHLRHINLEFTAGPKKERLAIVGWNNRARKYPVILDRLGTDRQYKMSVFQAINCMKAAGVY